MTSGSGKKETSHQCVHLGLVAAADVQGKVVHVEKPSCCKPHLSSLRDRDKRLQFLPPTEGVKSLRNSVRLGGFQKQTDLADCGGACTMSLKRETRDKTNGHNSVNNNYQMTPLKHFGPSAPLLLTFFPWPWSLSLLTNSSAPYCSHSKVSREPSDDRELSLEEMKIKEESLHNNNNARNRKEKHCSFREKIPHILVLSIVCFVFLAEIIPTSTASPIPSISAPTQTITIASTAASAALSSPSGTMVNNENKIKHLGNFKKLFEDDDEEHQKRLSTIHQLLHNNSESFNENTDDDYSDTKDDKQLEKGSKNSPLHETGSNGVSFSESSSSSDGGISGNQLNELTFVNTQHQRKPSSHNMNKVELGSGPHPKQALPAALKMRTQPVEHPSSSASEQQKGAGAVQVTNDVLPARRKQSSDLGDGSGERSGDGSIVLINNNNNSNDVDHDSGSDSISLTTTTSPSTAPSSNGHCWLTFTSWNTWNEEESVNEGSNPEADAGSTVFAFASASLPSNGPISVICNDTSHLAVLLNEIHEKYVSRVISLHVTDSSISTLNLSLFHRFPRLESLSVTHSNVSQIIGSCPQRLRALNISFNSIRKLEGSLFGPGSQELYDDLDDEEEETDEDEDDSSDDRNVRAGKDEHDDDIGNRGENMRVGNFSMGKRRGSSYFASSAPLRDLLELQHNNKSRTISPSSSSNPPAGKVSTTLRFNPTHVSENLEVETMPFLRREEKVITAILPNKKSHHAEQIGSARSTRLDQGMAFTSVRGAMKKLSVTGHAPANEQYASNDNEEVGPESMEMASSSSSVKEDNDAERGEDEKIRNNKDNKKGRGTTVIIPPAPSTASATDCGNNDGLCRTGYILRKVNGETSRVDGDGEVPPSTEFGSSSSGSGGIKSESYTYDLEKVVSEERDYYHDRDALSPLTGSVGAGSGSRGNKKGNEIKVGSKSTRFLREQVEAVNSPGDDHHAGRGSRSVRNRRSVSSGPIGGNSLEDIDLSHNKISEVPGDLLQLKSLKSLRLSGNQLRCDFVWERLADWYMKSADPHILKDGDDTFCGVVDDVRVFQYTVLGVLKAKKDVVETCRTVDKNICHECGLYSLNKQPGHGYNLSHQSPRGNVAIGLKLDCSYHNLSSLPAVPPQTWQLNVSGNSIKDLGPLKESMYENLLILDADSNEISTLDGLTGTSFLNKYNYISLQNNRFPTIPTNILSNMKSMRGQGVTLLGANFINCDCDVVKELKPLLLENSKQIKDIKEIYCKDMKAPGGDTFLAVKDAQYTDLCYLETQESSEMYLYLIIGVELILIIVIVAKVWHDQRTFRRTGMLPWLSAKMPRLPCDAMLESVKEPPHFNRSSSTNVRSFACEQPTTQSISSHVQLREVRSNSGQSEKSSQISQFSSFPCSSRTSSV